MKDMKPDELRELVARIDIALADIKQVCDRLRSWGTVPDDSLVANWAPLLLARIDSATSVLRESLSQINKMASVLARSANPVSMTDDDDLTLHGIERRLIEQTLKEHGWNQSRAADVLGISRYHLRHRLKKYGIKKPT